MKSGVLVCVLLLAMLLTGGEAWRLRRSWFSRRFWNRRKGSNTVATTTTTTTQAPTTTTIPAGYCQSGGVLYRDGESWGEGYEASANRCYGYHCDNGEVMHWEALNCHTTSPPPPTTTSPPPPPTTPDVPAGYCEDGGNMYPPGASWGEGYDKASNWCYGNICMDGQIVAWDNFYCKPTTTPSTTTPPAPTPAGRRLVDIEDSMLNLIRRVLSSKSKKFN